MTTPSGTGIRRLIITTTLALFFQFMTPSPAHAWFGWLEEWSGPGGWLGGLVDLRLVCFGPKLDTAAARDKMAKAFAALKDAIAKWKPEGDPLINPEIREAMKLYSEAVNLLENAQFRAGAPDEDRKKPEFL